MAPVTRILTVIVVTGLLVLTALGYTQAAAYSGSAQATANGTVSITAPEAGAVLPAGQPVILEYEVKPGPEGDHIHIYVDGGKPTIVRQLKGRHDIGALPPGEHRASIQIVTASHRPTGAESSVRFTVRP